MGKQDSKIVPQLNARVHKTGAREYSKVQSKYVSTHLITVTYLNIDEIDPEKS
jgi:hypothetical protein